MIFKHPEWMTKEGGLGDLSFFVVQQDKLPSRFSFWSGNVRQRIYESGEFPWQDVVADLPGTNLGQDGSLPRRAVSCRLIDCAISSFMAEPIVKEEIPDRLVVDSRTGGKAVRVDVIGMPKPIGPPRIIVPHEGHVVVRICWCSSTPITMRRERMDADELRRYGTGAWSYTPVFAEPRAVARYLLAFWEVPLN